MFQEGQTALHQAASAGHGETVAALILGGCDIGIQDFVSIYTTLHIYNNIYQYLHIYSITISTNISVVALVHL